METHKRWFAGFSVFLIMIFAPGCAALDLVGMRENSDSKRLSARALALEQAVENQALVVGMNSRQVVAAWGEPWEVLYAGRREDGNQKWLYPRQNSNGRTGPRLSGLRAVYFEEGRVVGWD
jgi:hypothetical protein